MTVPQASLAQRLRATFEEAAEVLGEDEAEAIFQQELRRYLDGYAASCIDLLKSKPSTAQANIREGAPGVLPPQ